jgi:hypothetical protein
VLRKGLFWCVLRCAARLGAPLAWETRYILFILDSATTFLSYKLLRNKSDALEACKDFKLEQKTNLALKLKLLNEI